MEVYGIFGHGCDMITDRPETTDIEMPEGCIYVTVVVCGLISPYLHRLAYAFNDPYIQDALKDPLNNLRKLNQYFTEYHESEPLEPIIHVHAAGTAAHTYVDSENTLVYDGEYIEGNERLLISGIYTPKGMSMRVKTLADPTKDIYGMDNHTNVVVGPDDNMETAYTASLVQPKLIDTDGSKVTTVTDFKRINQGFLSQGAGLRVRLSELFHNHPGIYYNFACRPACNSEFMPHTTTRAARSRNNQERAGHYSNMRRNMRDKPYVEVPPLGISIDALKAHEVSFKYVRREESNQWFKLHREITLNYLHDLRKERATAERLRLRRMLISKMMQNTQGSKGKKGTMKSRGAKASKKSATLRRPRSR
jgi:hypothetical protein